MFLVKEIIKNGSYIDNLDEFSKDYINMTMFKSSSLLSNNRIEFDNSLQKKKLKLKKKYHNKIDEK